ncbi:glycosyltransferase family 2 protein [Psychroserpens sp. XS_ASV72]|uniref:glycosyltransferase n=1 Tax=Psychroserpens sp. XS_ASV72 TaxID=3241293 RepID=UPI00351520CE
MQTLSYSFIIPVFNRPDEVQELLHSFTTLEFDRPFEIVIVEDGSTTDCKAIVDSYQDYFNIAYYYKQNSGPGPSRNYGMRHAKGNYFIILDSDCILPPQYLRNVDNQLQKNFVDCFGGPDAAHPSFSNLQKAINFSMTSILTTGGIRGGKSKDQKFQPRSFNMGLSQVAFEASNGFGNIHPGEDPDLVLRLLNLGFKTQLFPSAFVYHKRRISWSKFYKQVYKFGLVRPILNHWHPHSERLIYWLPTLFLMGFCFSLVFAIYGFPYFLFIYVLYFGISFLMALLQTKRIVIALMSILAIGIQFLGYGYGFLKSTIAIKFLNKEPEKRFPNLFFEDVN